MAPLRADPGRPAWRACLLLWQMGLRCPDMGPRRGALWGPQRLRPASLAVAALVLLALALLATPLRGVQAQETTCNQTAPQSMPAPCAAALAVDISNG